MAHICLLDLWLIFVYLTPATMVLLVCFMKLKPTFFFVYLTRMIWVKEGKLSQPSAKSWIKIWNPKIQIHKKNSSHMIVSVTKKKRKTEMKVRKKSNQG